MRLGVFAAVAASLAAMGFVSGAQTAHASPAHYFVVSESATGELSIVSHRIVDIDGIEHTSRAHPAYSLFEQTLTVEVIDKQSGTVSFQSAVAVSPWIRGEFHDTPHESGIGHRIKGHIVPESQRIYAVRIPVGSDRVLQLRKLNASKDVSGAALGAGALDIDLDRISQSSAAPSALPAGYEAGTVLDNGPSSNRLDLLIMGDGYTAAQRSAFIADATNLANNFLNVSPYKDFKQLVNVHWLFVPSNESGADKPACPQTPGSAVVVVDTAFDASFCASNIRRLVTVNGTKVVNAAAAVPGWDAIMVIVNDPEYGGSGGSRSVVTKASSAVQIAQHEFGHSFSRLADEYSTAYPGYPACSDVTVGAATCQPNVTDQTDPASIKWNAWIAPTTPIPTTQAVAGDNRAAGLWEGARYLTADMYRQCNNGAMRSLGAPFCKVDSEVFVKRLYTPTNGGWGIPASGVSLIEPASTPLGPTVAAQPGQPFVFRARVAGSLSTLNFEWRVDGVLAQSGTAAHGEYVEFLRNAPANGTMTVELKLIDTTSFLLSPHSNTRVWSVRIGAHVLNVAKLGTGAGSITSAPSGMACGGTCSQAYASATAVTLTASANAGSKFMGWLGACKGSAVSCVVTVNGSVNATAVFAPTATVASLDIDSNGKLEAHADGLLAMRYLRLGTLQNTVNGAIGTLAARTGSGAVTQYIENILPALDVDDDGELRANTDGLLIVRYLLGFRGNALVANGAIGASATRNTPALVETYLQTLMVPN
jgi:IgA Peptidase M64/Divergent InlB B-repeat domain